MSMTSASGRRQPLESLTQHFDALLPRPLRHPPRQRRLRGQAAVPAQRHRASPVARRQPQRRIVPQLPRVAVVPPALPRKQQQHPRQAPLRMPDPPRVAPVRQTLRQKPRHSAAPEQLAPRQRPRILRDPVRVRDPILIDLLKLNGASILFTPDVMAGRCS